MATVPKVQLLLKDRLILEIPFTGDALRIGRMKENDLVVNNLAVSRFHAVLHRTSEGGFEIEDLGSENGTEVNGTAVAGRVAFEAGDRLTIGKHTVIVAAMATDEPVPPAGPTNASDAWDAAQTYLADGVMPTLDPSTQDTQEPVAEVVMEEARPGDAAAEALIMPDEPDSLSLGQAGADLVAPAAAPVVDESAEAASPDPAGPVLGPTTPVLGPTTSVLGPTDSPDPAGAFSFGEDEIAGDTPVEADSGVSDCEEESPTGAPLFVGTDPMPSGEHTALFDFGAADDLGGDTLLVPEAGDPTTDAIDTAPRAVAVADDALTTEWTAEPDPGTPACPEPGLHAGWIVQRGGKLEGVVTWDEDRLVAGRSESCAIVLADTGVSRRHATFVRRPDGYWVEDEGSVNGTRVNGERVEGARDLRVGDVVKIEDFELTFVLDHQPIGAEVMSPPRSPAGSGVDPAQQTRVAEAWSTGEDAPGIVDLLDEAEEADDKDLETRVVSSAAAARIGAVEDAVSPVRVEIEVPREALPPALRAAMEDAGEDVLRLPAEIRIRLR